MLPHDVLRLLDSEPRTAGCLLRAREKLFVVGPLDLLPQHSLRQCPRGCPLALGDHDQLVPQRILDLELNHQSAPFRLR